MRTERKQLSSTDILNKKQIKRQTWTTKAGRVRIVSFLFPSWIGRLDVSCSILYIVHLSGKNDRHLRRRSRDDKRTTIQNESSTCPDTYHFFCPVRTENSHNWNQIKTWLGTWIASATKMTLRWQNGSHKGRWKVVTLTPKLRTMRSALNENRTKTTKLDGHIK